MVHPTKNHAADPCNNQYIPDTSNKIFYAPPGSDTSSMTLNDFKRNMVVDLLSSPIPGSDEYPKPGFQNAKKFCEDNDKAMAYNSFRVPTTFVPGVYTWMWYWIFNQGTEPYVTCFEVEMVSNEAERNNILQQRGLDTTHSWDDIDCEANQPGWGDGLKCDQVASNPCDNNNGGCSQICTNNNGQPQCSCNAGYTQSGQNCIENQVQPNPEPLPNPQPLPIDPCESNNGFCEQTCTNYMGQPYCSCMTGFVLSVDQRSCDEVGACQSSCNGGCSHECEDRDGESVCSCPTDGEVGSDGKTCYVAGGQDCGDDWVHHGGYCFKLFFELNVMDWNNAQDECEEVGGFLPIIHDATTFSIITSMAQDRSIWTGLKVERGSDEPYWASQEGHPFEMHGTNMITKRKKRSDGQMYMPEWVNGEPNNNINDDSCAYTESRGDRWEWLDTECHNQKHFICQKKASGAQEKLDGGKCVTEVVVKVEIDPSSLNGMRIGYTGDIDIQGNLKLRKGAVYQKDAGRK